MRHEFFVSVEAVVVHDDKVLLIRRRPESRAYANTWALPGGHLEHGESPAEAALRELKEETNVDGKIVGIVGSYGPERKDPRGNYVGIAYMVEPTSFALSAGDDARGVRWWPVDSLPDMAFNHADVVSRAISKSEAELWQ